MSHKTNLQIFGAPILLGIATMLGLGAGLIGDGGWDGAAGILLAAPLVATGWYWQRPPMPKRKETRSQRATGSA
jgi:hypothetical protein